jgi:membrane protease YdiL (CAAX protease family)
MIFGRTSPIWLFIVFTFAISWGMVGIFFLTGGEWNSFTAQFIATGYMFIPLLVSIGIIKFIKKEPLVKTLSISFRFNFWWVIAWIIMPVLAFSTLGISLLFPTIHYSPDMQGMFERFSSMLSQEQVQEIKTQMESAFIHPVWLSLINGMIAGVTINAIAAFGEETGWRGFLVNELKDNSFIHSSLIIGLIWGVWHAPIILAGHNYPEHPYIGVIMMIFWCILLSPIFLYIRLKAKSVIAAAILHGTLNGTFGISFMLVTGGSDLLTGMTGLAGFISLIIANGMLYFYDTRLRRDSIIFKKISDT